MIKALAIAMAATALFSLSATAAPVKMTNAALDQVAGGCGCEVKGNNGWGNGADGTNAGSFSGGTAPSKSVNGTNGPSPNTNPTTSNGR